MPDGNLTQPRLPARYYALLCDRLEELGVDRAALLRAADLEPHALDAGDATLTLTEMEALVNEARARTAREDLGFELGLMIKPSSHEILGYGILSSATLGAALAMAARYVRLMTPAFAMRYRPRPGGALVEMRPVVPMSPAVLAFHLDVLLSSFDALLQALIGRGACRYAAQVSGHAPRHKRYRELTMAHVTMERTGLPGVDFALDRATVLRPLPLADRRSALIAQTWCESLIARCNVANGIVDWVGMMLSNAGDAIPSLADLARVLHLAPHTLERRLRAAGTRFRELAGRARHERACALLRDSSRNVTEIALQLGYGDVANFSRAFKREAGMPPREFRAATRVGK